MDEATPFRDCDTEYVLSEMSGRVRSPEMRSLWNRMQDEVRRKGPGAAITYVGSELTRIREEFLQETQRIKADKAS